MAAMLVSQTKPLGIELYFYANKFFNRAGSHVNENALYSLRQGSICTLLELRFQQAGDESRLAYMINKTIFSWPARYNDG